jgi:protein-tyrosine phosphatase
MLCIKESLSDTFWEIKDKKINYIISLTEDHEIQYSSPIYYDAIEKDNLPCKRISYPIQDQGVPEDKEEFLSFLRTIKDLFEHGNSILIHCMGGHGRTGTFAICFLVALGFDLDKAVKMVEDEGSYTESSEQEELLKWIEVHYMN